MAAERNISIYQGDTYTHDVTLNDSSNTAIDITDRTYAGQIRPFAGSTDVSATFTTEIVNAGSGLMRFSLTSAQTANIAAGTYVYDLQETNGSVVLTIMSGTVTVTAEVTR
tara:strand:+ start:12196 stop:12528 length:333 start_codon:yes stop_codon:yes gene_type:complete